MKTIAQILSAMTEARELLPENSKTITSIAAPNVYTPKATAFARRTIAMLRSSDSSVFRRRTDSGLRVILKYLMTLKTPIAVNVVPNVRSTVSSPKLNI